MKNPGELESYDGPIRNRIEKYAADFGVSPEDMLDFLLVKASEQYPQNFIPKRPELVQQTAKILNFSSLPVRTGPECSEEEDK